MNTKKLLFNLLSLSCCGILGIGIFSSSATLAQLEQNLIALQFQPPKVNSPKSTVGGGTRGNSESCIPQGQKNIVALLPNNNVGLTLQEYPTVYLYIPKYTAQEGLFTLMDEKEEVVYETTFAIPNQAGIVSLELPKQALPPLEVGKMYHWYVDVMCNSADSENNPSVNGWVQGIQPPESLLDQLNKASLKERVSLYAQNGIWYDTLTALLELRNSSPKDLQIDTDWESLLSSVELNAIAKEPLVDCCQNKN